ncbi:MAG: porin [Planktomarina sp.]
MKRILLTSTALVMTAGIAAAEVSFGGDAELKYNSVDNAAKTGDDKGMTYGVGLTVTGSMALDNGITASLSGDIDLSQNSADVAATTSNTFGNMNVSLSDAVFSLKSDTASLTFGDTGTAANTNWVSAGDMEADGFYEANDGANELATLRGDVEAGAMKASVSYGLYGDELEALQVFASYNFGSGTVGFAMEDGEQNQDESMGIYVKTAFSGADVTLAYATDGTTNATSHDSMGIKVSYPVGDVIVGVYYVSEDGARGNDDNIGIDVAYTSAPLKLGAYYRQEQTVDDYGFDLDYDMGNGLTLKAGYSDGLGSDQGFYVGGAYDLGGGASVSLTHVDVKTSQSDDEYFGDDDNEGTTVKLSLKF